MTMINMTSQQILEQARREAHTYSHRKLRGEIMSWIDTIMEYDLPDEEMKTMVKVIHLYYLTGKRKGTNFGKMPDFYRIQLTGLIAAIDMGGI